MQQVLRFSLTPWAPLWFGSSEVIYNSVSSYYANSLFLPHLSIRNVPVAQGVGRKAALYWKNQGKTLGESPMLLKWKKTLNHVAFLADLTCFLSLDWKYKMCFILLPELLIYLCPKRARNTKLAVILLNSAFLD